MFSLTERVFTKVLEIFVFSIISGPVQLRSVRRLG